MDTKLLEKKMESISPFELKNRLIDMADESLKKTARTMLNAGRGNPNWIATAPREAFFLLGSFGLEECRRIMDLPEGIAGIPEKKGIASRFEAFLKEHPEYTTEPMPLSFPAELRQQQDALGLQLLGFRDQVEGFYIVRLRRNY